VALGLGMETGVRPGGRDAVGRTGPPSLKPGGGDRRMESLLRGGLPLSLMSVGLRKLGIAVWLIEGWLWKRTKMWKKEARSL